MSERKFYIVWDQSLTEGYITSRLDEAQFAAGKIKENAVAGFGVSAIAYDFRQVMDDDWDSLTIEHVSLPSLPSPPEQGEG